MIVTNAKLFERNDARESYDDSVAAQTSSLFVFIAAFWFLVTPLTFFGVSAQSSAWNAWIVGSLMALCSLIRMSHPRGTAGFSLVNTILSLWVLVSPFVFGYIHETYRVINTLAIGVTILSLSLTSFLTTEATAD
jgi:hypothetical protein